MLDCPEDKVKKLRKVKQIAHRAVEAARNTLVTGCLDQGAYIQFASDVKLYNLYAALLSAKQYEENGCFAPGTAQKAMDAAMKLV